MQRNQLKGYESTAYCFILIQFRHGSFARIPGKVTVNSQQVQSNDRKIFDQIQQAANDFVYSRSWTNLTLEAEERLDCNINIQIKRQISKNEFEAQLAIQLNRPVFNSTYSTGMFNFIEKDFFFVFNENQGLDFDLNTFHNNLSSSLGFYMYLLLGVYFDSFSKLGGTPFYELNQSVVQTAEGANQGGWRSSEKNTRNKYWMLENFTNPVYTPVREASYLYHRQGLDKMTTNQTEARQNILKALELIQKVNKEHPNSAIVQLFMDAKISELVNIFTPAPEEEQRTLVGIIRGTSPINMSKFKGFSGT